ncbi:hypothetical protein HON49_07990 [archaeon]|nr:hypothetical protein [archaeon]
MRYEGGNGDSVVNWPVGDNGPTAVEGFSVHLTGLDVDSSSNWVASVPSPGVAYFSDVDNDFVPDQYDNCMDSFNSNQNDIDFDGYGDVCDNCANDYNSDQSDVDFDLIGDVCDLCPNDQTNDLDQDGICEDVDNCPGAFNPSQKDDNLNGLGNICDPDSCDSYSGFCIGPMHLRPKVYIDQNTRRIIEDYNEPGAVSNGGEELIERIENYAFEGEQIHWEVLVWSDNGKETIADVAVSLEKLGVGDIEIESNCREIDRGEDDTNTGLPYEIYDGEELIYWNEDTMKWFNCTLTVETPMSMHGEHKVIAYVIDTHNFIGLSDEVEQWYLNPVISLGVSGDIRFKNLRPGATDISESVRITNNAEIGSGVLLDLFIAGTDFYDSAHAGTMCPNSNVLELSNFKYYASNGAYNTCEHLGADGITATLDDADAQCYVGIPYYVDGAGDLGNNNFQRIIDDTNFGFGVYPAGNVLSPGADMILNFKLRLPEPCTTESFTQGQIKFFGEAI